MSDGLRIGDLAELAGVSARSLRYYEQQGLLEPDRGANGYRVYAAEHVEAVGHIRLMLEAGLTTETVRGLLPCFGDALSTGACPAMLAQLDEQLAIADRRIACQQQTRDVLAGLRDHVAARAQAA